MHMHRNSLPHLEVFLLALCNQLRGIKNYFIFKNDYSLQELQNKWRDLYRNFTFITACKQHFC